MGRSVIYIYLHQNRQVGQPPKFSIANFASQNLTLIHNFTLIFFFMFDFTIKNIKKN